MIIAQFSVSCQYHEAIYQDIYTDFYRDNVVDIHIVGTGSALRSAVICFYLSNEGLSLLENAAHIGLPIPDKMKDVLAQLHGRTDEKKDETQEDGVLLLQ